MFCNVCGSEVNQGEPFCPVCGSLMPVNQGIPVEEMKSTPILGQGIPVEEMKTTPISGQGIPAEEMKTTPIPGQGIPVEEAKITSTPQAPESTVPPQNAVPLDSSPVPPAPNASDKPFVVPPMVMPLMNMDQGGFEHYSRPAQSAGTPQPAQPQNMSQPNGTPQSAQTQNTSQPTATPQLSQPAGTPKTPMPQGVPPLAQPGVFASGVPKLPTPATEIPQQEVVPTTEQPTTRVTITGETENLSGKKGKRASEKNSSGKRSEKEKYQVKARPKKLALKIALLVILLIGIGVGVFFGIRLLKNKKRTSAYYKQFTVEQVAKTADNADYVCGQLLLHAKEDVPESRVKTLAEEKHGSIVGQIPISNDYQIEFEDRMMKENDLKAIMEEWKQKDKIVASVQLHYAYGTEGGFNYKDNQWKDDLDESAAYGDEMKWDIFHPAGNNWAVESVWAPMVWDSLESGVEYQQTEVGIIDTVIDTTHKDLTDRFAPIKIKDENDPKSTEALVEGNPVDSAGNPTVKNDYSRYAGTYDNKKTNPDEKRLMHGTHVSGIIAANMNDDFGISGVAQNAILHGYAMAGNYDEDEKKTYSSTFEWKYALSKMMENNIRLINVSMHLDADDTTGTSMAEINSDMDRFLQVCIDQGYDYLLVKSAGDEKLQDLSDSFLAGISTPSVKERIFVVGGAKCKFDKDKNLEGYIKTNGTNYGERIDIYAPGPNILSDIPGDRTEKRNGTSGSAAFVTGGCALVMGILPDAKMNEVKEIVQNNCYYTVKVTVKENGKEKDIERPYLNVFMASETAMARKNSADDSSNDGKTEGSAFIDGKPITDYMKSLIEEGNNRRAENKKENDDKDKDEKQQEGNEKEAELVEVNLADVPEREALLRFVHQLGVVVYSADNPGAGVYTPAIISEEEYPIVVDSKKESVIQNIIRNGVFLPFYPGFIDPVFDDYGFYSASNDGETQNDNPKGFVRQYYNNGSGGWEYDSLSTRFSKDRIDWIAKNIFHMSDEEIANDVAKMNKQIDGLNSGDIYEGVYESGDYYYLMGSSYEVGGVDFYSYDGNGLRPVYRVQSVSTDGEYYYVEAEWHYEGFESNDPNSYDPANQYSYDYPITTISSKLKLEEIDGKKYWTVYETKDRSGEGWDGWKDYYEKIKRIWKMQPYLDEGSGQEFMATVANIDGDDIVELILPCDIYQYNMCILNWNKLQNKWMMSVMSFAGEPHLSHTEQGYLVHSTSQNFSWEIKVYQVVDGVFCQVADGGGATPNDEPEYYRWNGKECSKSEYDVYYKKYCTPEDDWIVGEKTYSELEQLLPSE